MHNYERVAFLKFFITYFVSVALLILVAGYFYFSQMRAYYLKSEEFSLIEYARHIKMGNSIENYKQEYRHEFLTLRKKHIDIRNFNNNKKEFSKILPINKYGSYLKVFKKKKHFKDELWRLRNLVISIQVILLFIFAFISYMLAKSALKPLQDSIFKLDKFAKDLIHDLNTPVTSIKLNMKLIQKSEDIKNNKAIQRLNKSVHDISELHENLTLLLQEETFQMEYINLCDEVNDVILIHKQIYPNLTFSVKCQSLKAKVNANAIRQILQNIISNACKYNIKDGYVHIYNKSNVLYIEDSGKGIKEPDKIFDRLYSGEHSSGIGLDIVKRLAFAMDIKIKVETSSSGSCFILIFN